MPRTVPAAACLEQWARMAFINGVGRRREIVSTSVRRGLWFGSEGSRADEWRGMFVPWLRSAVRPTPLDSIRVDSSRLARHRLNLIKIYTCIMRSTTIRYANMWYVCWSDAQAVVKTPINELPPSQLIARPQKDGDDRPLTKSIRLNSELAKKLIECLEYIVVHELTHLLVPNHSRQFADTIDGFLPDRRGRRDSLNRLRKRHEE